jgi:hypothetical protein
MVGRAMLTKVASSAAIPEPSTVIASTHRPGAEEYERAGASAVVMSRTAPVVEGPAYGCPPGHAFAFAELPPAQL